MKKSLFIVSLLCASTQMLPAGTPNTPAQPSSLYWKSMRTSPARVTLAATAVAALVAWAWGSHTASHARVKLYKPTEKKQRLLRALASIRRQFNVSDKDMSSREDVQKIWAELEEAEILIKHHKKRLSEGNRVSTPTGWIALITGIAALLPSTRHIFS